MKNALALKLAVSGWILFLLPGCSAIGPDKERAQTSPEPIEVQVSHHRDVLQGHYILVATSVKADISRLSKFDLLLSYDPEVLTLNRVMPGGQLLENDWEYFRYYKFTDPQYNDLDMVRIYAIADIPDVDLDLAYNNESPEALAVLQFLVTTDRNYECLFSPIRYFWRDCEDNLFYTLKGDTLGLARAVYDTSRAEMDSHVRPEWLGPPVNCLESLKRVPVPMVDFVNGGIDIVCSDSIDNRGDMNCNGLPNEVADAVLYAILLLNGMEAFDSTIIECAIGSADINNDGIKPTVADFQYLVRVIHGDAVPHWDNVDSLSMTVETSIQAGEMIIGFTSNEDIGAALVVLTNVDAASYPALGPAASDMDIRYDYRSDTLKVLIYNIGSQLITAGTGGLLTIHSDILPALLSAEVAGFYGNPMKVEYDTIPSAFWLSQNYPNPFSALTIIELHLAIGSEWNITIMDSDGEFIKDYSGYSEPGVIEIEWDGTDIDGNPVDDGVYFYRATVGDHKTTKTMILQR